ncbi:MAG: hypothetical protein PHX18_07535 [Candidatus Gastranaerophilales bacterium]|nr:hypothetical protein [Candidatus Gastranaerophilales bacterium]
MDFDPIICEIKPSVAKTHKLSSIKHNKRKVKFNTLPADEVKTNKSKFTKFQAKVRKYPTLKEKLVIQNTQEEFYNSIKIRKEPVKFSCIARFYNTVLQNACNPPIKKEIGFSPKLTRLKAKDICIANSIKTVNEILEVEPYTKKFPQKRIMELPVKKYPVKEETLSKTQLDSLRTKLAIQAKCKKYSISIENIYDKFPKDYYTNITPKKDYNMVECSIDSSNKDAQGLQLLVTGRRKYDPQLIKTLVDYKDIDL